MTTPHLVRYFPLVARPRPACRSVEERVGELLQLADTAHHDPVRAATVLNQAALLASDLGLPQLARTWCHEHALAQFSRLPATGKVTIQVLEPVVNLARLRIRAGEGDRALNLLEQLFDAVCERTDTVLNDGFRVPCSSLTSDEDHHREVVQWVWRVLLADGARALTTAGRWSDAHDLVRSHRGVGNRMSDGRQIAVIDHATSGDFHQAQKLVETTEPGEPWEQAVTSLLAVISDPAPQEHHIDRAVETCGAIPWTTSTAVFHTRLLVTLRALVGPGDPRTDPLVSQLIGRVLDDGNGYCARDLLSSSDAGNYRSALAETVRRCGLETASPGDLEPLADAVRVALEALRARRVQTPRLPEATAGVAVNHGTDSGTRFRPQR